MEGIASSFPPDRLHDLNTWHNKRLSSDGHPIDVEDYDLTDPRFALQSRFQDRFPQIPEGILMISAMEKKFGVPYGITFELGLVTVRT